jgi:serine/threonine protein kinase
MSPNQCPQCGTGRLFAAETERLCSKCLLELGLEYGDGPLEIGDRIDHYEIQGELGSGGMGHVYLAKDTKLKREVALKVLSGSVSSGSADLVRFRREAQALAALKHPNVVTVYSVEESDGAPYLVMELVEGVTLDTVVRGKRLDSKQFFELACQLTEAVAAAHSAGIVHRDLKPSNLMLDSQGTVKVLDFGLAKPWALGAAQISAATATEDGHLIGTVPYMSPEQLQGGEIDARSDVFSLGIVLYELATSEHPFESPTIAGTISAIMRDEPPLLKGDRSELSPRLEKIVSKCLRKRPEDRYESAAEVAKELSSGDTRSSILSLPTAEIPWVGALSWDRSWAVATALLLVILSIGIFMQVARDPRPEPSIATSQEERLVVATEEGDVTSSGAVMPSPESEGMPPDEEGAPEKANSGQEQREVRPAGVVQSSEQPAAPLEASDRTSNERLAGSASSSPAVQPFMVEAALYRSLAGGNERLATGSRVRPGDKLFMSFRASRNVHVYVLNEDDLGEVFVLFPLEAVELKNPIQASRRHRLPGSRGGEDLSWQVSSAGGEEHLLVIASPTPLAELEELLRNVPRAMDGEVTYIPVPETVIATLRGIGRLAVDKNLGTTSASDSLFSQVRFLVDGEESSQGVWIRRVDLKNPL